MRHPRILVLAGSARAGSFSAKLAAAMTKEMALADAEVTRITLADYPMPIYDGDLERDKGVPEAAKKLVRLFQAHQGVLIVTPEHNACFPALLKNTLDWMSRPGAQDRAGNNPFQNRIFAVSAASTGQLGGTRALAALRPVLELGLGALVIPEQVALARADKAFNAAGGICDMQAAGLMRAVTRRLIDEASRYLS
ncbi:NAD(P)H-dependent oxidoreductase [Breoghania sp.]|uniref:NADPH-dependent FMN reductase n=1 Tax=Breoghania sp. TaxID=2065378 RepID=UPI0029CAA7E5|nr:NAD(P)H-dependent oxidoreductase [Breoghania sp.]